MTKKYLYAVVVSLLVIVGLTGGMFIGSIGKTNPAINPSVILCPDDNSPYVWTPIGTRSENFQWICLKCGHHWTYSYSEGVYKDWLKTPLTPECVRDYAILYLRFINGTAILPDPSKVNWTGGKVTPEGIVGGESYAYKSDGLTVTIRYPVVSPENTVYKIKVESQRETVWEGQLWQRQFTQHTLKLAFVNNIAIVILESFPVQVNVIVQGELSDACTEISEITQKLEGNTFFIKIMASRPLDAVCAQVITPFEKVIALNVVGLKAGVYTVNVNGVTGTFELQTDNFIIDDDRIDAEVGKEFTITLDSNPSTGYQWQLAKSIDEDILKLVRSEYLPPATDLLGAGGKEAWTFKAVGSGTTEISFEYVRSWEKGVPPAEELSFLIVVQ